MWNTAAALPSTSDATIFLPMGVSGLAGGGYDFSACTGGPASGCPINPTVYANASSPVYKTCTTKSLYVRNYTNQSGTPLAMTVTLFRSGTATALACTVAATRAATCTSSSAVVLDSSADTVALQVSTTNSGGFQTSAPAAIEGVLSATVYCE